MRRLITALSCALALGMPACATLSLPPPGKPALPDIQFRMRDFRLANGMRILVEENHGSPLVGVFTTVGVGSSGDPQGKEGLAHLIEHLVFRSKPGDGKMSSWNALEAAGVGTLNAMTGFDDTTYFEVGSKDVMDKLIQIEIGRMTSPLAAVDKNVFDVEREVVRNELRQSGENQQGPAYEMLQQAVFPPSHHYSRPIGGSHASLTAITIDDAKAFVAKNYRPENMTMLILGDVDLTTFEKVLQRDLPPGFFRLDPARPFPSKVPAVRTEPPAPPPSPPTKFLRKYANVATPELYVVWSLPRSFDTETVLLEFTAAVAQGNLSQASHDPDIVGINVGVEPGLEASMMIAQATLRKGEHPEKSLERILDQVVGLWGNDAMYDMAEMRGNAASAEARQFGFERNSVVVNLTVEAENILARGMKRVQAAHFTGDPLVYGRTLKELANVEASQISHFAEKYLIRDRARAVLVEPFPPDSKDASQALTGLAPAPGEVMADEFPPARVLALGKSRGQALNETVVHGDRDLLVDTLPNGLKVVVKNRRNTLPIAVVSLTFPVGDGASKPFGAASMAGRLASPKSNRFGDGDERGILWGGRPDAESTTISAEGANGNLENMLAQLSEKVSSMHVEARRVASYQKDFVDFFETAEQQPRAKARRAFMSGLYGDHPVGRTVMAADQRKISDSDIKGWIDKAWSPKGAVLVITGNVDPEKTLAMVNRWLGEWKAPAETVAPMPPLTVPAARPPTIVITNQPNDTQAQLMMGCLASASTPQQELADETIAELMGAQLFRKVRQELGASYGIHGYASTHLLGVARIEWQGAIENTRLAPALAVIKKTMDAFETESLDDADLSRARWGVARSATMSTVSSDTVASLITRQVLRNRPTDDVDRVFETLAGMPVSDFKSAWTQCKGNFVLSIIGDEPRVKAALKDSGF